MLSDEKMQFDLFGLVSVLVKLNVGCFCFGLRFNIRFGDVIAGYDVIETKVCFSSSELWFQLLTNKVDHRVIELTTFLHEC